MIRSSNTNNVVVFGLLLFVLLIGIFSLDTLLELVSGRTVKKTTKKVPRIIQKASHKFEKEALFYNKSIPKDYTDSPTFNKYLTTMDPSSEYLEPTEYSVFATSNKDSYIGIGMEIEKNESGQIVCFPFPGSPAYDGGVESGDILEAVGGEDVTGLSIYKIGSKIMGSQDSKVKISIVKPKEGRRRKLVLGRRFIETSSVMHESTAAFKYIRIHAFTVGTNRDLKAVLSKIRGAKPIVLDLRDNPGGDLHKAIDSAMLLLGDDHTIVTIKGRKDVEAYRNTTPAISPRSPVYLWQNENTASAAEIFIAALTQNGRAESIGRKSFGKGITQDVVELSDGSAIVYASGYLLPPNGEVYHQKGLPPDHKLDGERLSMTRYLKKTKTLIKRRKPK